MEILFYYLVIISAIIGLSISSYIFKKKNKKEKMVCPIGHDCHTVVHSDYSKFMGIRLELVGMIYYLAVLIAYIAIVFFPEIISITTQSIIVSISALAFLFSLYLTFLQAFVIKNWCTWCLFSALFSTLIFLFGFLATNLSAGEILSNVINLLL